MGRMGERERKAKAEEYARKIDDLVAQKDYTGAAALQALMGTPRPLAKVSTSGQAQEAHAAAGQAEVLDSRSEDARIHGTTARFHLLKNQFRRDAILHSRVNLESVRLLSSGPTSTMRISNRAGKGEGKCKGKYKAKIVGTEQL